MFLAKFTLFRWFILQITLIGNERPAISVDRSRSQHWFWVYPLADVT